MKSLLLSTALALMAVTMAQAQTSDSPTITLGTRGNIDPAGPGMSNGTTTGAMGAVGGPTASAYGGSDWSLLPGTRRGYVGLNVGKPSYQGSCTPGFPCDDANARAHLYTGGFVNDWLGAEIGYQHEGKADRAGGQTRAEGINLSLVLHAPIGQFHVFGKAGGLYGRTKVSADLTSGVATGKETGWGRTYGVGVGFDFTPSSGVVLEWARNRYRFVGDLRADIDSTNLGYVYRF